MLNAGSPVDWTAGQRAGRGLEELLGQIQGKRQGGQGCNRGEQNREYNKSKDGMIRVKRVDLPLRVITGGRRPSALTTEIR